MTVHQNGELDFINPNQFTKHKPIASDHFPITIELKIMPEETVFIKREEFRNYKNTKDMGKFKEDCQDNDELINAIRHT